MDLGLILLRLAHVVAGAAWVGGAFVMILLVTRTARLRGADGDAFMTTLLTQGKAARYFEIAAVTTVLAGGLLYFRASGGFQIEWITSPSGIGFTIGAVAAIVSLVWGGVVVGPAGKRAAAIEAEVAATGGRRHGSPYLRARRDPPQARHLRRWPISPCWARPWSRWRPRATGDPRRGRRHCPPVAPYHDGERLPRRRPADAPRRDLDRRPAFDHPRRRAPGRRRARHRRRGGLPIDRDPRSRLDRGVLDGRGDDGRGPVDRLGGEPGARSAQRQHPGPVHGAQPR